MINGFIFFNNYNIQKLNTRLTSITENFNGELSRVKSALKLEIFDQKASNIGINAANDVKFNSLENKIELGNAQMRTMIESNKYDKLKYVVGAVFGAIASGAGVFRLFM